MKLIFGKQRSEDEIQWGDKITSLSIWLSKSYETLIYYLSLLGCGLVRLPPCLLPPLPPFLNPAIPLLRFPRSHSPPLLWFPGSPSPSPPTVPWKPLPSPPTVPSKALPSLFPPPTQTGVAMSAFVCAEFWSSVLDVSNPSNWSSFIYDFINDFVYTMDSSAIRESRDGIWWKGEYLALSILLLFLFFFFRGLSVYGEKVFEWRGRGRGCGGVSEIVLEPLRSDWSSDTKYMGRKLRWMRGEWGPKYYSN